MSSVYGLIGKVLGHSFSREMFSRKFFDENIDAEYRNFEIPSIDEFPDIISSLPNLSGLNVTIPYKTAIIPFLDQLSDEAKTIGAVNVVKIGKEIDETLGRRRLVGHNTDVAGFVQSIRPHIKSYHKCAYILGTGGVSKAVACGLDKLGIMYKFVSRKAYPQSLPSEGDLEEVLSYSDLTFQLLSDAIVVNCTPLGMFPSVDTCPDIPYQCLNNRNLLFDCVYNPLQTLFLAKGNLQGCDTLNGIEMLRIQALEAWKIWNEE